MGTAELTQQARIAIREGRLAEARSLLRQVNRLDPQNHAAWLLLAQATPDEIAAAHYIERARLLQPESPLVQSAQEKLAAREARPTTAGVLNGRAIALVMGLLLVSGLLAAFFGSRAWEQVQALQNESLTPLVAAPLTGDQQDSPAADRNIVDQPQRTAEEETVSQKAAVRSTAQPAVTAAAVAEQKTTDSSLEEPVAAETRVARQQPVEIVNPDRALPAAILSGIQAEATTGNDALPAETDELAEAQDADQQDNPTASENSEESTAPVGEEPVSEQTTGADQETKQEFIETPVEAEIPASYSSELLPPGVGSQERWIDVNLTTQTLVAYEGETPVLQSLISSGTWQYPTVTGQFRTWIKYESQNMTGYHLGYNYELPNVPYVMYFYKDFAIHGAYWHNNFGTPMSHGCVNMNPTDAGWLFEWAPLGTVVNVHH